jgi:hypothetical protein
MAVTALALSGVAQAADIVITEAFDGFMNSGSLDNANLFGEGAGANIGGQAIHLTLTYDLTSFNTYAGYAGAPACGPTPVAPCTNSYGEPGYYGDANGESWTQNATDNNSLTISYEVNGHTTTISNSPGSNMEVDIALGGSPAGFEANMYGNSGGGFSQPNNGCCFNYREFFNGTTPWVPGSIDTQAGMDAFAATVTSGSFWYVPSPQFSSPYDILSFSNVTSAQQETSATPEPGTIGLLSSALIGLGIAIRRKRLN